MTKRTAHQQESGGEIFQTESRLLYGGYLCTKNDKEYDAQLFGSDAIVDRQGTIPSKRFSSRYEIRAALAQLMETLAGTPVPTNADEERIVREAREQMENICALLRDEDADLPELQPEAVIRASTEQMHADSILASGSILRDASDVPEVEGAEAMQLDQSSVQALKQDIISEKETFDILIEALKDNNSTQLAQQITTSYNTMVLYLTILRANNYRMPELTNWLENIAQQMCTLLQAAGGDMMGIRTVRGTPRPLPANTSDMPDITWNSFHKEYDDALHTMSIAEHIAERRMAQIGGEAAYLYLIERYNSFIQTAKRIQETIGPLRHYEQFKGLLAGAQMQMVEQIDYTGPIEEV